MREMKDQALEIINTLIRELKQAKSQAKSQMDALNKKIEKLESPVVYRRDYTKSKNVDRILADSRDAMERNIERITKEIANAKQK